ncbi:hypothetical protein QTP88_023549 [Uroleucon formosanum]
MCVHFVLKRKKKLRKKLDLNKKDEIKFELQAHSKKSQLFFQKMASKSDNVVSVAFDTMQTQPLPKLGVTDVFFCLQIWLYNITFVINSKGIENPNTCYTHTWLETVSGRGPDDFQDKIIKLVGISILETFVKVKVGNTNSDPILVKSGLRQGDAMSPILFNIVVEKVVREMNIIPQEGVKFQESSIGLLAYADDLVIMEDSQDGLKDLLNRLEKAALKVELHINEDKTKYMVVGRRDTIRLYPTLNVNNRNFKRTRQFKYLGSILSERNEIEIEIGTRIQKSDERKFLVLERKILRKIFGPVKDMLSGEWRIRKNDELKTLFHKPSILETIKNKRLLWAGHAWRSQNPLIRMVLDENPNGKRPLGRPRQRWEDGVRDDVKALGGGEDWRSQASNRENWRQGCMSGWS